MGLRVNGIAEKRPRMPNNAPVARFLIVPEVAPGPIDLDKYGANYITRAQPATISKLQGREMDVAVVCLPRNARNPSSCMTSQELYTACWRGKRACLVVADMELSPRTVSSLSSVAHSPRPCPSADFVSVAFRGDDRRDAIAALVGKMCSDPDTLASASVVAGPDATADRPSRTKIDIDVARLDAPSQ